MQFQIVSSVTEVNASATSILVITIDNQGNLSKTAEELPAASRDFLKSCFDNGDIHGEAAETLLLHHVPECSPSRILLLGRGAADKPTTALSAHKLLSSAASIIAKCPNQVAFDGSELATEDLPQSWWAEQLMLALHSAQYRFTATKPEPTDKKSRLAESLVWVTDLNDQQPLETGLTQAAAIASATDYAKDLGNMPPNICTPSYLAEQAESMAADGTFSCKVYDEKELDDMGAGSFVSVAKGSNEPGKIIVLHYQGSPDTDSAPHMLVGKGITFDSGGISLKPGLRMDEMKYDMCGAASVLGTMQAIKTLKPAINIVAIITTAENMPAGHASKPGDVVTSLAGKTIEILNTDAEGRLVLCDALTLGIREYAPASIVDIATLTGACMAALGKVNSGLFTEDDQLADELQTAAKQSRDKVWRLPLEEDYQSLLDTNFADMANIGGPLAGATTAACFLARFTEGTPWAHLDIAGSAWGGAGTEKGSTGRPVPLLTTYLLNKAK